jgi:outer membrane protein TolC
MPSPELLVSLLLVGLSETSSAAVRQVDLAEALNLAFARNRSLAVVRADVARVQAAVTQARAGWLPTLNANASLVWLDADRQIADRVITAQETLQANLQLQVPLVAARAWLESARAAEAVEVAQANERERRRAIGLLTARVYLGVVQERQALAIAERAVQTSRAALALAVRRKEAGAGTRLEEARAERELQDNLSRLESAWVRVAAGREALGAVTAEDGPLDASVLPELEPGPGLAEALAGLEDRPDLATQVARRTLAEKRAGDAWGDYLPTLLGVVTPLLQTPPTPTVPSPALQAQLLLSFPIFDGGLRYARQAEREALLSAAEATLEEARLSARSELRTSYQVVEHRAQARVSAEAAATLAEETLRLVRRTFEEGSGTQLELIDAERAARDAATSAVLAAIAEKSAMIDLLAAAGRFPAEVAP